MTEIKCKREIEALPTTLMADKLSLAASKGQLDKVQELLQSGAKFDSDQEGRTALHYAALNGFIDICQVLIVHGCSLDHQDVVGFTALHRACSQGHVEVCKLLLEAGCTLDCQDEHGNTALHEAAWNGFSKTLEVLIKFNSDVSIVNKSGFTALHLAAQNGHNESSRVLIYAGCNTDTKNNYGDTALHTAARYGHAGVTRIFISARCALNEQNKNGDTPLHIAAALKRRKITKLLVEAGIDPYLRNKQNETAVDVARRKEYSEVVQLITTNSKRISYCQPSVNASPERPTVSFEGKKLASSCETKPAKEKRFFFFKRKKKNKEIPTPPQVTPHVPRQTVRGTERQMGRSQPVQGFFNKYIPKDGVQYYKDLAGNIKQGPIGYTPICQCIPVVKRLEKNLDETCENIYEHIDASHQILQNRINQLDRRTSQQMYPMDRMTNERHHATYQKRHQQSDGRFPGEPRTERLYSKYNDNIKSELEAYVDAQSSDEEGDNYHPHHHDDSGFYHRSIFFNVHENENGRLFRTRSDETLSQSDYSARHRKKDFYENRQAAMQHIRAWQNSDRNWRRETCAYKNSPTKETHLSASRHRITVQPSPVVMQSPNKNQHESFLKTPNSDYVTYSEFLKSPPASTSGQRCHPNNPHPCQTSYTPTTIDMSSQRQNPPVIVHNKSEQSQLVSPRTESHCNTIPRVNERPSQLFERDQVKIKSPMESELSSANINPLQCTTPRKYESSVPFRANPDFNKSTLNHGIPKPSQPHWSPSYKASPSAYKSNPTKQDDGRAIGRYCSQDILGNSPSKNISNETKPISHHHPNPNPQQTVPLSHSKSNNNIPKDSTSENNSAMQPKTSFLPYGHQIPKPAIVPERTQTPCSTNHGSFTRYTPPTKSIDSNQKTSVPRPLSAGPSTFCNRSDYHNILSSPSPTNCIPPYKSPPPYHSMRSSPQGDVSKSLNDQKNKFSLKGNADSQGTTKMEDLSSTTKPSNNISNNFPDGVPSGSYTPNNQVHQLTTVKFTGATGNNLTKEPLPAIASMEKKNLSEKLGSVSLDHVHQADVSHSKEDSSSNPDSGYSSRIYGTANLDASNRSGSTMLNSVNTSLTTPSSFSGTDQSFCGSPANLSPYHQASDHGCVAEIDYENQLASNKQYFESVTAHLQNWYHTKKRENMPKKNLVLGLQQQQLLPPNSYGTNLYSANPTNQGHNYIRGSDV